ncbi:hypothetical protein [Burkholderia stagnalis]|uniref:hypothetical protein n=1 Tax=Burkholderia stagnalis TaxID=1503054 RepID=UPI000AD688D2|nr:hypothetical protein [Burkholderia stagnalis]
MTIANYAIVENGVVTNVIVWDGDAESWHPPEGSTAILLPSESPIGVDWTTVDGVNYTPPAQPSH